MKKSIELKNKYNYEMKVYFDFISNNDFYYCYLGNLQTQGKIKKSIPLKYLILHYENELKAKIFFTFGEFENNSFYELVYFNNDFILFYNGKNGCFISYNLNNDLYNIFEIDNYFWCESESDLIQVLEIELKQNNIKYNDNILNDILTNFIQLN